MLMLPLHDLYLTGRHKQGRNAVQSQNHPARLPVSKLSFGKEWWKDPNRSLDVKPSFSNTRPTLYHPIRSAQGTVVKPQYGQFRRKGAIDEGLFYC